MEFDDFAPRMAEILANVCQPVQKGEYVAILSTAAAEPLILALYEAVLRRGGHPVVFASLPQLSETFYEVATDEQLDFLDPLQMELINRVDRLFQIVAPYNTKALSGVDPTRYQRHMQAQRPRIERYFERIESDLGWNICAWPTQAGAQEANMGLRAYSEFIYTACALDQPDPAAYWQGVRDRQPKLVDWLKGKSRIKVTGPGVDLALRFDERPWVNSWGSHNFPSGEIFTGPVEDSVNGCVAFNYPTVYQGREVSGVKLAFKDGVVIDAAAAKGEDFLLRQLETDEGARRLGEFAIGTNYGIRQFTGNTLFDEKIGGTIHLALGAGFPEVGGTNKRSTGTSCTICRTAAQSGSTTRCSTGTASL